MSSWGNSSPILPKIGSSKKVFSLSKSKPMKQSTITSQSTVDNLKICVKEEPFQSDAPVDEEVEGKGKGRMEEPLIFQEKLEQSNDDVDMDDGDSDFWQQAAELSDLATVTTAKSSGDTDMDDLLNKETPRFESLSMSDDFVEQTKPIVERPLKRKRVGEDVFTKSSVKEWQGSRIKAWESRYTSPEGYYFRFVAPGEGQQNGGWSGEENKLFMKRYNEWMEKGYKIGASWGAFSQGIPHRVGYQCMNYYRKLVSDGRLKDESYEVVDGKLKQVHKERAPGSQVPTTELGPEWKDEDIKQEEKNVDMWLKEFHGRSGQAATSRPIATQRQKATPRVMKNTSRQFNIGSLVQRASFRGRIPGSTENNMLEDSDPEIAHLQQRDWETEWCERLEKYKEFVKPYLNKETRYQTWLAKQEWRRSLLTTEMLIQKNMTAQKSFPTTNSIDNSVESPAARIQQSTLSRFFSGVKKLKIDTPDDFISHVRIPNDLYSGVKQIRPLMATPIIDTSKSIYREMNDINDSIVFLDELISGTKNEEETRQSNLEGILVDPPWEFYIADGKNDGKCTWNLADFQNLMEKATKHMTAGMVFVWVHKLIQADLVRIMYNIDCKYVENFVWFKKYANNVHLDEPSPYISSTKEILLMFKKGDGFEMRHQRSPDVIIDFVCPKNLWVEDDYTEPKPTGVYDMIETLLPKAGYDEELKRGRFLELWAKKSVPRREGWIAIHQNKIIKNKEEELQNNETVKIDEAMVA